MVTQKDKKKKTILAIFVEGDTEVEFYGKMVASIRQKVGKGQCSIEIKNVKGVGNYQNKVCRIFENSLRLPDERLYRILLRQKEDLLYH